MSAFKTLIDDFVFNYHIYHHTSFKISGINPREQVMISELAEDPIRKERTVARVLGFDHMPDIHGLDGNRTKLGKNRFEQFYNLEVKSETKKQDKLNANGSINNYNEFRINKHEDLNMLLAQASFADGQLMSICCSAFNDHLNHFRRQVRGKAGSVSASISAKHFDDVKANPTSSFVVNPMFFSRTGNWYLKNTSDKLTQLINNWNPNTKYGASDFYHTLKV